MKGLPTSHRQPRKNQGPRLKIDIYLACARPAKLDLIKIVIQPCAGNVRLGSVDVCTVCMSCPRLFLERTRNSKLICLLGICACGETEIVCWLAD